MNETNILIVEDELIIAKNTAKKLEALGYQVTKIVSSGQAAIDYIISDRPNLILMDIAIKGEIDGIETAETIKEIADIPLIFLTAYASDETLERASKTGCYGYLIKPFRDRELQATVKMALSKYQEQSTIQKALQSTVNDYSSHYDDIYKDSLTNLPNKLFLRDLFDYLSSTLGSSVELINQSDSNDVLPIAENRDTQQPPSKLLALFNISLDRLQKVSSFLTKEQQDTLVKEIAQRLRNCLDSFENNGAIVYLEADNYVMMVALDQKQTAQNYGQEIINQLRQAFNVDNQEIFLPTNIGIAFSPLDSTDIEELLEQSQKARDYATSQGGNRCQLFTFAFNIKNSGASESLTMEADLYRALEREELELYYQPKINPKNDSIVGAEALIRWNHPAMGRITADKFIPLAEENGLIRPISEWIMHCACKQMNEWHNAGFDYLRIAVNLSGFQFRQSDLFHQITQILFKTSLNPHYLELELTETILVENIKTNIQRLNLLKKLGIQIALDDFGTGYSSLGYLQQFPFNILKIDSCFIRNIDSNKVNAVITKNTIEMAHQLGLKVVAEGVETKAELNYLRQCQCDEIQGFLYSRPLAAKEFQKLIMNNTSLPLQRV
ncbi:two-component system response regulator [Pleurocapsa sp. FMAR1]|uniref:two-component system response regulator n=1 Tax=Pleurocapsa sp. FMAR1 TaxID=3040204 RepID=UPI0029C6E43A|nr:EAL domain-containing protein [Pleurocapsa sp. FMAR1]